MAKADLWKAASREWHRRTTSRLPIFSHLYESKSYCINTQLYGQRYSELYIFSGYPLHLFFFYFSKNPLFPLFRKNVGY
jgi:hypothetical protein